VIWDEIELNCLGLNVLSGSKLVLNLRTGIDKRVLVHLDAGFFQFANNVSTTAFHFAIVVDSFVVGNTSEMAFQNPACSYFHILEKLGFTLGTFYG